jgi:hypothetical protein
MKEGYFVRTAVNFLAEKSAGCFMSIFGPISLFMELFRMLLLAVSVNICTHTPVFGL